MASYFFGPLLVRSADTDDVCGGDANSTAEDFHSWRLSTYNQLAYYMYGQTGVALFLLVLNLTGTCMYRYYLSVTKVNCTLI